MVGRPDDLDICSRYLEGLCQLLADLIAEVAKRGVRVTEPIDDRLRNTDYYPIHLTPPFSWVPCRPVKSCLAAAKDQGELVAGAGMYSVQLQGLGSPLDPYRIVEQQPVPRPPPEGDLRSKGPNEPVFFVVVGDVLLKSECLSLFIGVPEFDFLTDASFHDAHIITDGHDKPPVCNADNLSG